jgi:hypothetical protein
MKRIGTVQTTIYALPQTRRRSAERTTPMLVSTRARRSTSASLLRLVWRLDWSGGARVPNNLEWYNHALWAAATPLYTWE